MRRNRESGVAEYCCSETNSIRRLARDHDAPFWTYLESGPGGVKRVLEWSRVGWRSVDLPPIHRRAVASFPEFWRLQARSNTITTARTYVDIDILLIASVLMSQLFDLRFSSHRHWYILLQLSSGTPCIQSFRLLILGAKVDADAVHAVPLVLGVSKALTLENVPKMSATVVAHNLRPHHAHCAIGPLANSTRHGVPEGGPATA
jgi:hypothetical protein